MQDVKTGTRRNEDADLELVAKIGVVMKKRKECGV